MFTHFHFFNSFLCGKERCMWSIFSRNKREITQEDIESSLSRVLLEGENTAPKAVTEEGALAISAVWDCVGLISDTIASLPIHLYKRDNAGRKKIAIHPAIRICNAPNTYSSRFDFLQYLMVCTLLWGNGYIRIYRDRLFNPLRCQYLKPYECHPFLSAEGNLFYKLSNGDVLYNYEIIHVKGLGTDGITGKSPIKVHAENLVLTKEVQSYGEKFFSKGGNVESVFEAPGQFSDKAYDRLKKDLYAKVVGMGNAHAPLLLEGGMKYQRVNIPLEDAQFLATRKFQKGDIASIYRVPPHMIGDLDRSTNNNIEQQAQEFISYCLLPYITKLELELNAKLLREEEKDDYYFKFSLTGLLRADSKSRSEYYKNLHLIGVINANEIRELEEMNPYEGGDMYFVQQNMQTVENAKNNTNQNGNKQSNE